MPNLFPTFDAPDIVDPSSTASETTYGTSWVFDFEAGDFVTDGSGRVLTCDGYAAWAEWCVKAVLTERFGYLAYGPNYGAEVDQALRQPSLKATDAELERTITETLLADPRTQSVVNFSFTRQGDGVSLGFDAVPVVGTTQRIEVKLNG